MIGYQIIKHEPSHEKMCLMSYANNKGADQPAQSDQRLCCSLLRWYNISRFYRRNFKLASVAVQAGLCLAWSETPEDMFCRVVAHVTT